MTMPLVIAINPVDWDRFWSKVDVGHPLGCWVWTAGRHNGYGQFHTGSRTTGRRKVAAHRWAYIALMGVIPDGLTLDHLCRNRACVNPDHLEPVTVGENVRRGNVGRWVRPNSPTNIRHADRCLNGHLLAETLAVHRNGRAVCRACSADYLRNWRARRAA